ncbi:HlyD family efflux transporter periplasmic adaptor subunit [Burkholderia orbicola]|uniref:HlyD family secretion protein n=1 Tax=Burkholderia orbicola TaxID=2978683 RepID=UPI0026532918|nr:HlyD family efflux transporter periplasmic adaptor subunit [Burkholderia orbicola]MDN7994189.1 HlyD family efflux transporter periplasmic adaptor subunit [Burkholderia orbicola]
MTDLLFRDEALDATKHKLMGTVSLYSPPSRWITIGVATTLTLAFVAFIVFGSYTKRERVAGQLLPAKGLLTVAPPMTGTVIDTRVHEGQQVEAGAELMTVSGEVASELGSTREMVGRQLAYQRSRFQADLESQLRLSEETRRGLVARSNALAGQRVQLGLERTQRLRQVDLATSQLDKLKSMRAQGYASNSQVEQQEAALLDAQARLQDLARQRLDVEQQMDQCRQQLRELPLNTRNQQSAIERKLAELDQSIAENEARRVVVLRAPQPGVVAALLAKPGQAVNAGQSVVSMLPVGAGLEAQLMVPSRAIGFVRPGARVVLRYDAYPFQKFGQQFGRVTEVSRTALTPQEAATLTGRTDVREQLYRVTVALDRQDVIAYGKREALRPGMALEADVLIDTRRLIEWVLEPLYALGRRASA